jgi:uncharacterized protein YbaR (Trm112 family)
VSSSIEHLIPAADLHRLAIPCPTCKTELTVDLAKGEQRGFLMVNVTKNSLGCPLCKKVFLPEHQDAIRHLLDFYEAVTKHKTLSVTFRVSQ